MGSKGPDPTEDTADQRALAEISARAYADFYNQGDPTSGSNLIRMATERGLDTQAFQREVANVTNADYEQQFGAQQEGEMVGLASRSGNLASGNVAMGLGEFAENKGFGLGQAQARGIQNVERTVSNNASNLMALAQGQKAGALEGMYKNAEASSLNAITDARSSAASRNALLGLGTAAATTYGGLKAGGYFGTTAPNPNATNVAPTPSLA